MNSALKAWALLRPPAFFYEFTVDSKDHDRLANGFPELQKLVAAIHKEIAL
jgi:hypothetical protein